MYNQRTATRLLKIANAIAEDKGGEISFLNVVKVPMQVPLTLAQGFGKGGMNSYDEFKKSIQHSIRHRYLVRLSHDVT